MDATLDSIITTSSVAPNHYNSQDFSHYPFVLYFTVKCTLVQALRLCTGRTAHKGTTTLEVRSQRHAPTTLYPRERARYPLYRRLGGPQVRSGQVWKISPPPGLDPQTLQPVDTYIILTKITIICNCYGATTTQLTTLYLCIIVIVSP